MHPPEAFRCQATGHCCTSLRDRWDRGQRRLPTRPGDPLVRLAAPPGLRLFSWEAGPFPRERLVPLLAVPDALRERLIAVAYVLDEDRCPLYEGACTIHAERPLVCRAYPLLVVEDEQGVQVTTSRGCPSRVPVAGAVAASARPYDLVRTLYPHEAAAARAVPETLRWLCQVIEHLATVDLIAPAGDLDESTVDAWAARGVLDLVTLAEGDGPFPHGWFAEKAGERLANHAVPSA